MRLGLSGRNAPRSVGRGKDSSPQSSPRVPTLKPGITRRVGIVVVVIIVIVIAALAVVWGLGGSASKVQVTAVNLQIGYSGIITYFGPDTQSLPGATTIGGHRFSYTINFTNSGILSHSVNSIGLMTNGFTLISESPPLPVTVAAGGKVSITLTIQTPTSGFDGPLAIGVFTT